MASTTSRLFDVTITAPGASMIAGIANDVVLPVLGPAMITIMSSHVARSCCRIPGTTVPITGPGPGYTPGAGLAPFPEYRRIPRSRTTLRAARSIPWLTTVLLHTNTPTVTATTITSPPIPSAQWVAAGGHW